MTPHAKRPPAFPVALLKLCPPLPKSSTSAWITIVRPKNQNQNQNQNQKQKQNHYKFFLMRTTHNLTIQAQACFRTWKKLLKGWIFVENNLKIRWLSVSTLTMYFWHSKKIVRSKRQFILLTTDGACVAAISILDKKPLYLGYQRSLFNQDSFHSLVFKNFITLDWSRPNV